MSELEEEGVGRNVLVTRGGESVCGHGGACGGCNHRGEDSALGVLLGTLGSDPVSTADHHGPGSQATAGRWVCFAPSLGSFVESQYLPASLGWGVVACRPAEN